MEFQDFPTFLGKSGKYEIHPPKLCASLVATKVLGERRLVLIWQTNQIRDWLQYLPQLALGNDFAESRVEVRAAGEARPHAGRGLGHPFSHQKRQQRISKVPQAQSVTHRAAAPRLPTPYSGL